MRKKVLALLMCGVMLMSLLTGCGGKQSNGSESEESKTDGGTKIGISVLTMSGQFFIDLVASAEETLKASGGELLVNDADNSSETQVAAIENFISAKVDGIIICAVDPKAVEVAIKEAKEAGIAVVCLTSKVEGYDAYVGADEYQLGYTQGEAVGKWIAQKWGTDEKIEAATLNYDLLESVIQRKNGIMEGIKEYAPNVEFVADATAADQTEGMTNTENFLQANPNIRMVCGVSDGAALGAYEAFKANQMTDPDKYIIAGVDATDEALNKISEGTIYQFTVDQNPKATGKQLVEVCQAIINGEDYEKDYSQNLVAVTPDNISDYK
ncbi:sugar ABC transporter substrate-binding protein [Ohessyouella blattaphilus]|uniref:Sugar ABC transporter substrate-binding protein n=1 Tax=Ohessyouella blattaphilus TaxID=2949333 RepID=A0ABT1EL09_9FIRM|nr:sugar ABC transporter substrate-binding protein [Ohessyouella blattaphilus]MCP1110356.1 sugar ABC transporter substrate-binding protein [Ohessyouella blattaphilus]MCR8563750.1 sugar ABC transporter substrate-binding protein [Ohessyouella blattaphilus]